MPMYRVQLMRRPAAGQEAFVVLEAAAGEEAAGPGDGPAASGLLWLADGAAADGAEAGAGAGEAVGVPAVVEDPLGLCGRAESDRTAAFWAATRRNLAAHDAAEMARQAARQGRFAGV